MFPLHDHVCVFRVRCIHFSVLSLSLPPQALINVSIISLTVLRGIEVNVAEADEVPHWLISFRLFIFLLLPLPHTALLFSQNLYCSGHMWLTSVPMTDWLAIWFPCPYNTLNP